MPDSRGCGHRFVEFGDGRSAESVRALAGRRGREEVLDERRTLRVCALLQISDCPSPRQHLAVGDDRGPEIITLLAYTLRGASGFTRDDVPLLQCCESPLKSVDSCRDRLGPTLCELAVPPLVLPKARLVDAPGEPAPARGLDAVQQAAAEQAPHSWRRRL